MRLQRENTLWGSRLTTSKGRELAKLNQVKNYSYLSTGPPTYWLTDENKFPDLLDFFITNGISSIFTDLQSSYDVTSKHSPITATLSTSLIVSTQHHACTTKKTGIPTDK
jgi:hypothetical protein